MDLVGRALLPGFNDAHLHPLPMCFYELGVTAVVQPLFLRSEHGWLDTRLGEERRRSAYPFRSLVDAGARLAGSSDAPIEEPDVLAGVQAAVTRHGFVDEQALTVGEALAAYTTGSAFAQRRESDTGALAEGMRADLVVLSADPMSVPAGELSLIEVRRTVVGGAVVFDGGDGADRGIEGDSP